MLAQWNAEQALLAKQYDPDEIEDPTNSRLMRKISDVGRGALNDEDLQEVSLLQNKVKLFFFKLIKIQFQLAALSTAWWLILYKHGLKLIVVF